MTHFYDSVLAMKFANCNEIKLKQDNVAKLMHQQDMISEIEGILKIHSTLLFTLKIRQVNYNFVTCHFFEWQQSILCLIDSWIFLTHFLTFDNLQN